MTGDARGAAKRLWLQTPKQHPKKGSPLPVRVSWWCSWHRVMNEPTVRLSLGSRGPLVVVKSVSRCLYYNSGSGSTVDVDLCLFPPRPIWTPSAIMVEYLEGGSAWGHSKGLQTEVPGYSPATMSQPNPELYKEQTPPVQNDVATKIRSRALDNHYLDHGGGDTGSSHDV